MTDTTHTSRPGDRSVRVSVFVGFVRVLERSVGKCELWPIDKLNDLRVAMSEVERQWERMMKVHRKGGGK